MSHLDSITARTTPAGISLTNIKTADLGRLLLRLAGNCLGPWSAARSGCLGYDALQAKRANRVSRAKLEL